MTGLDKDYYTFDDGNYVHILPLDACLESIKARFDDLEGIIKSQKQLLSQEKHDIADDEIIELNRRLQNSFELSDEQLKKIRVWQKNHDKKHATIGEKYIYSFFPTAVEVFCICKCCICDEEFDICSCKCYEEFEL